MLKVINTIAKETLKTHPKGGGKVDPRKTPDKEFSQKNTVLSGFTSSR